MGKGKLQKFAEMETFPNVFQYPFSVIEQQPFEMKGSWHQEYFKNNHPIVLELGCGKGEYTVELARLYPDMNFIGVDIKGARMWTGAKMALEEKLGNVAFLHVAYGGDCQYHAGTRGGGLAAHQLHAIALAAEVDACIELVQRLDRVAVAHRHRDQRLARGAVHGGDVADGHGDGLVSQVFQWGVHHVEVHTFH